MSAVANCAPLQEQHRTDHCVCNYYISTLLVASERLGRTRNVHATCGMSGQSSQASDLALLLCASGGTVRVGDDCFFVS